MPAPVIGSLPNSGRLLAIWGVSSRSRRRSSSIAMMMFACRMEVDGRCTVSGLLA
jgi:hypothetical protein